MGGSSSKQPAQMRAECVTVQHSPITVLTYGELGCKSPHPPPYNRAARAVAGGAFGGGERRAAALRGEGAVYKPKSFVDP